MNGRRQRVSVDGHQVRADLHPRLISKRSVPYPCRKSDQGPCVWHRLRLPSPPMSTPNRGEVPEWSNGTVSKTVELERVPRVRIPVSPPFFWVAQIQTNDTEAKTSIFASFIVPRLFRLPNNILLHNLVYQSGGLPPCASPGAAAILTTAAAFRAGIERVSQAYWSGSGCTPTPIQSSRPRRIGRGAVSSRLAKPGWPEKRKTRRSAALGSASDERGNDTGLGHPRRSLSSHIHQALSAIISFIATERFATTAGLT